MSAGTLSVGSLPVFRRTTMLKKDDRRHVENTTQMENDEKPDDDITALSHVHVWRNFPTNSEQFIPSCHSNGSKKRFPSDRKKLFQTKVALNSNQWGSSASYVINKMAVKSSFRFVKRIRYEA
ncbi:hypothetical protein TNCV_3069621 [Trichonephila clavipes]|nr:hypothetical protein TNCV_3069621 [Trichonephila clavipes]